MSDIDKHGLRLAAQNATQGDWKFARSGFNAVVQSLQVLQRGGNSLVVVCKLFRSEWRGELKTSQDAAFIAAANPKAVLALLDELEPMALAHLNLNLLCDVYRSAYEEARHDGLVNWEAASSLAEENEDLKRKLEAADKRIAELEARTVIVPSVSDDAFWLNFNGRYVFLEETYRSAVFKALDSVGIKNAAGTAKGE